MKYLYSSFFLILNSSVFAIDTVKQNCCTLYDGYENGTELTIGDIKQVDSQNPLEMTPSTADVLSGYCDSETHTVYAWEQLIQSETDPTKYKYIKTYYNYSCLTCDKSEQDFPSTYQGFDKQSIESSSAYCLSKIQNFSKDGNGSAYQLSDKCPTLIGCYYNLPDSNTDHPDDNTGTDTNTDNNNNTIPDSIAINNLDTVENKLTNINSDTLEIKDAVKDLNSKFEIETNSDFATKLTENSNLFKQSIGTIQSNYEAVITSFTDLKDFVTSNPFSFNAISSSTNCNYNFEVLNKTISVNLCKYNYLLAPVITFFLKIYFLYALIKLNIFLYLKAFVEGKTE